MTRLSIEVTAALLILAILGIRTLLKGHLSPRVYVCLWLVAALRLLVPGSLPLPVGLMVTLPSGRDGGHWIASLPGSDGGYRTGGQSGNAGNALVGQRRTASGEGAAGKNKAVAVHGEKTDVRGAGTVSGNMDDRGGSSPCERYWDLIAWSGTIAILLYFGMRVRKEKTILAQSLPLTEEERRQVYAYVKRVKGTDCRSEDYGFGPGGRSIVPMRISDRIDTPMAAGMFRPYIVLSRNMTAQCPKQLGFVLLHEMTHIRRRDNLLKLFVFAAAALNWYNPCAWLMLHYLGRDIELSCDEKVISLAGAQERADYASSMVFLAERKAGLTIGSSFGNRDMKERILIMMKYRNRSVSLAVCGALLLIVSLGVFAQGESLSEDISGDIGSYTDERQEETEIRKTADRTGEDAADMVQETEGSWGFSNGSTAVIRTEDSLLTVRAAAETCPDKADVFQARIIYREYDLADAVNSLARSEVRENAHNTLQKEADGSAAYIRGQSGEMLAETEILEGNIFSYTDNGLSKRYLAQNMTDTAVEDAAGLSSERELLIRHLSNMEHPDVEVTSASIFSDGSGRVFHDILFMPTFHSIPLEVLPGSNFNPVEEIFGRLDVAQEGVIELTGNFNIAFEEEDRPKGLLSDEELLGALEEHIRKGRLSLPPEAEVNRIKFCYVPIKQDKDVRVLPVWRLWLDSGEMPEGAEATPVSEIGLDAANGEIRFVY